MSRGLILVACLLASVAPVGGVTAQAAEEDRATLGLRSGPDLFLSGPFGRVAGGAVDEPAGGQHGDVPLDTFVRNAPIELDAGKAAPPLGGLSVTATNLAGHTETLSSGAPTFAGPSTSGPQLIVARAVTGDGATSQRAWLIDVPDRDPTT